MKHTLAGALVALVLAAPVSAQTETQTPAQTQPPDPMIKAEGLPTVFLTDRQGAEHRGRLIRVEPSEVVLLGPSGERTFKREEITLIEKRGDSLKNGAIIGAAVGVLAGFLTAGMGDCPDAEQSCDVARVTYFAISVGLYTAIGTGIDAAVRGRTVLYRAYPTGRLAIAAGPGKVAVGFNVRW